MKKKPLFIFLLFIIGWNLLFFPIFYISARFRAYKILNPYIQETKNSIIINEKFGKVENVKINNILKYSTKKINHTCIEMKVIANNKKHDICTIAENKVQGYIINNRIYEEITSESYFEVNNNNNDFKKDLKKYLNKEIKFPETREPIIYNVIDNKYKIVSICKYQKKEDCNNNTKNYLNKLIDKFSDKYKIIINNS